MTSNYRASVTRVIAIILGAMAGIILVHRLSGDAPPPRFRKPTWQGLDLLAANASSLSDLLESGELTSVELVTAHLEMIDQHDGYLHAMVSLASVEKLRKRAEVLDEERRRGRLRGPLHGIPIIIKDNIATHPDLGMPTTAGSAALADMRPSANADLVDKLLAAGLIIIGKANLSEWAYCRSYTMPSGWSALGGQCQSAYVRGGLDPHDSPNGHSSPSGSSTGSAVGVSAGYAPLSIGTETDGSLVNPAARAALYTIKPTIGLVSQSGIIPISHNFDSAGPMAKTPLDLATLLDVIVTRESAGEGETAPSSFVSALKGSWADLSIGTLDYSVWWADADDLKVVESATHQMHREVQEAYDTMKPLVKSYVANVPLVSPKEYELDGENSEMAVILTDFKKDLESFLQSAEYSPARDLQDLIDFNKNHADIELPPGYDDQDVFLDAQKLNLTSKDYEKHRTHVRHVAGPLGADLIFDIYKVDLIVGPTDSTLHSIATGGGYPVASVPLGYLDFNGRPHGMSVLAPRHHEANIIKFMSLWEGTFGPRKVPPLLRDPGNGGELRRV